MQRKSLQTKLLVLLMACMLAGCAAQESKTPAPAPNTAQNGPSQPADPAKNQPAVEKKQDSGRYTGRIDNNSIEIKISGVPDDKGFRAFALDEPLIAKWEQLGFKTGDNVKFTYIPRGEQQPLITEISKI